MTERELAGQVALVTGGGRGIGARVARELTEAGMRVAVTGRTREQVTATAEAIGVLAIAGDVSRREAVERMVGETERTLGPVDLLVAYAGVGLTEETAWDVDPDVWWHVFEVNVLGVYLSCRAVVPAMIERGTGRIVITGSGAAYLPGSSGTAYAASKAAVWRFGETLARQLEATAVRVFVISPGLVRTEMTSRFPADAPWTPPELAPRLVRVLASGRADELAGRYIHAEHDDVEDLIARAREVRDGDLNAIRLRR